MEMFIFTITSFVVVQVLTAVICTEALTELVVKSELFYPVRKWCFESKYKVFQFIHSILDCGYCFSVWAAMLSVICIFFVGNEFILGLGLVLIIHRLSNLFHYIMDAVKNVFR